jgi:uncharacterized protein
MSALSTPDPEGAKRFYADVFGWTTSDFGPATMFHLPGFFGGEPTQPVPRDVVAAMMPGDEAVWSVNFWVDDADAAAERAERLGGKVLVPPVDDVVGRNTVIADPAGAVISLSKVVPPSS